MSSIIINSFYRALTSIDEYEGIKNLTVKQLTRLLVDQLYPEDGVLTWENDKTLKIKFNGKVPVEEETHAVEITIPVAEPAPQPAAPEPPAPEPEVKEIKVKEVKPKLTKEEKEAEKAEKAAAAKAEKEAKAAAAKAEKEAKAAAAKAAKASEPKPKVVKAKFVGNLEKLNATQDKTWKKVAADAKVELTDDHKKRFIIEMNELDNAVYNTKKLETWMTEFFTPKETEVKTADVEMFAVDYKDKEYFIDDDGNVYEPIDGTDIPKKVGKVGMAYFAGLEMPAE